MRINTAGFNGGMNIAFDRALAVIVAERRPNGTSREQRVIRRVNSQYLTIARRTEDLF